MASGGSKQVFTSLYAYDLAAAAVATLRVTRPLKFPRSQRFGQESAFADFLKEIAAAQAVGNRRAFTPPKPERSLKTRT